MGFNMFQYKNGLILDDLGVPWGKLQIQVAFFSLARRCNLSDLSVSSGKSCDRLWPHGVLAFFVWSTVHDGNSYASTFRHALGCCSWEQCWMNLLERVSQKYDRQLVELTEPFAWRKWSNIVGTAKAVTTYYNLLQPITTSEHDQKNVLDLVSPGCHRNGMAYVSWICQLHRQGACHKSD